jgi:uncharacterized BrkB/YihY/UPF0761 family membrane protein
MRKLLLDVKHFTAWRVLGRAYVRWVEADGNEGAAAFAYYMLLSLLPLAILMVTVATLFVEPDLATQAVVQWVKYYVPLTGEQEHAAVVSMDSMLAARGQITLVAIPVLLWSSLQFLGVLIQTTNRLWRSSTYNWWRLPLKGLVLLGITISAVLLGILVPTLARMFREWLDTWLGFPDWLFAMTFQLFPWLVLFYGLFLLYEVYFASFNALYGALGGMVALLLWIHFSSSACVFGICVCAALAELRAQDDGASKEASS